MASDGTLGSTPLSYTQGTCMEAGRLIWKLTGDTGYLRKAIQAGRGQMTSTRMNEVYNYEMVSRDEGTDENKSIFHAVMFHWFTRMILDTEVDSFDGKIRKELYDYLYRHASYYWATIDKTPEGWPEAYFGVKCYQPRSSMNGDVGGSLGDRIHVDDQGCQVLTRQNQPIYEEDYHDAGRRSRHGMWPGRLQRRRYDAFGQYHPRGSALPAAQ